MLRLPRRPACHSTPWFLQAGRCFAAAVGRRAAAQRNRDATKQGVRQRHGTLSGKRVDHLSHDVFCVRADWSRSFAPCRARRDISNARLPCHSTMPSDAVSLMPPELLISIIQRSSRSSALFAEARASVLEDFADTPIFAAHWRASSAAVVSFPPITEISCCAPSCAWSWSMCWRVTDAAFSLGANGKGPLRQSSTGSGGDRLSGALPAAPLSTHQADRQ